MLKFLILLSLAALTLATTESEEYCRNAVCDKGETSVACTYAGKQCGELVKIDENQILRVHNELRSKVATGQESGFPRATKMGEVQWDADLAKLAQYNVETCKYGHDQCRGTKTFPKAGQNIAQSQSKPPSATWNVTKVIEDAIRSWYSEVKDCDVKYIGKFDNSPKVIGHFTQLIWESANSIGCAAVRFVDLQNWDTIILACNYAYGNMLYDPVYKSGTVAGSDCTERSTDYEGLCAKTQVYPLPAWLSGGDGGSTGGNGGSTGGDGGSTPGNGDYTYYYYTTY